MRENTMIGWFFEYKNILNPGVKKILMKKLKGSNTLHPESLIIFLDQFLLETTRYESMVIWFAPKSSYILRIIPEKIELLLESKETIFECQRTKDGTILNQGKTNGEGLAVIKNLFKKILEVKATSKKKRAENR